MDTHQLDLAQGVVWLSANSTIRVIVRFCRMCQIGSGLEVLIGHVDLELERLDGPNENACVLRLVNASGTWYLFREICGNAVRSSAWMVPMERVRGEHGELRAGDWGVCARYVRMHRQSVRGCAGVVPDESDGSASAIRMRFGPAVAAASCRCAMGPKVVQARRPAASRNRWMRRLASRLKISLWMSWCRSVADVWIKEALGIRRFSLRG